MNDEPLNDLCPGFQWDRHWVVVRADSGKFVTQRQPEGRRLALVEVELPAAALESTPGEALPPGLSMRVSARGMKDVLEVRCRSLHSETKLSDSAAAGMLSWALVNVELPAAAHKDQQKATAAGLGHVHQRGRHERRSGGDTTIISIQGNKNLEAAPGKVLPQGLDV